MKIVHISGAEDSPFDGAAVAIRQHIAAQQDLASVRGFHVGKISAEEIICRIREDRPELAVFHEIYRPAYLPVAAFLRKEHIPYIVVPHGGLTERAQSVKRWKKIPANLLFFNRYLRNAAAIQFLSEGEKEESRLADRGFVCPNGTSVDVPVRTRETPAEGIRFLFVGRPEVKLKGLDLMLEAIDLEKSLLREKNVRFDLVGPDAETVLGPMIREKGLEDLVFTGAPVSGNKKDACFIGADVYIQTSRSEGMPMTVLEAAAHGLCCLITEGTRMGPDIRGADAGIVCETNAHSIAEGMKRILSDPSGVDRWGKNARRLAETKYDWKAVGGQTVSRYRELIGRQTGK